MSGAVPPPEEMPVEGGVNSQVVARLMEMGYSKEDVTKALKAANNNAEIALEFLLNVLFILISYIGNSSRT